MELQATCELPVTHCRVRAKRGENNYVDRFKERHSNPKTEVVLFVAKVRKKSGKRIIAKKDRSKIKDESSGKK